MSNIPAATSTKLTSDYVMAAPSQSPMGMAPMRFRVQIQLLPPVDSAGQQIPQPQPQQTQQQQSASTQPQQPQKSQQPEASSPPSSSSSNTIVQPPEPINFAQFIQLLQLLQLLRTPVVPPLPPLAPLAPLAPPHIPFQQIPAFQQQNIHTNHSLRHHQAHEEAATCQRVYQHRFHPYNAGKRHHAHAHECCHGATAAHPPTPYYSPEYATADFGAYNTGKKDTTREFKERFTTILQALGDVAQRRWESFRSQRHCTVARRPCIKVYMDFCVEFGGDLGALASSSAYAKLGSVTKCGCSE